MFVRCDKCGTNYDDADRFTFCPHELIMSADDLVQKKQALELIGRTVRFAHQPNGPDRRIISVAWNGMVTVDGMDGVFAPHLFVKV